MKDLCANCDKRRTLSPTTALCVECDNTHTCPTCGATFDTRNEADAEEWYYSHVCGGGI